MGVTVKVNGMGRSWDKIEMFCEANWTNERTTNRYSMHEAEEQWRTPEAERELRKVYSFKVDYLSKQR